MITELYRVQVNGVLLIVGIKQGADMPYVLRTPGVVYHFETRSEAFEALCKATGRDAA